MLSANNVYALQLMFKPIRSKLALVSASNYGFLKHYNCVHVDIYFKTFTVKTFSFIFHGLYQHLNIVQIKKCNMMLSR